ncbi:hypothetical protein CEXT_445541 [Caerostris extrusa]|uniref:Uncharacterized protein n=1 Tax=Caerostris extrusa TaxID=172846 RepID=A0AAV4PSN2_CAEEX|nr:hypothetical protein CEXT_445541 [Caerostris extrusa]
MSPSGYSNSIRHPFQKRKTEKKKGERGEGGWWVGQSLNPLATHKGVRMCPPGSKERERCDKSLLSQNMASDTISKA